MAGTQDAVIGQIPNEQRALRTIVTTTKNLRNKLNSSE